MDYCRLNVVTTKNRYPLPLIKETLDRLQGAHIYTKLNLRGAYILVHIKEGEEWKTVCRARYGLFEYLVMHFVLTNTLATFQNFMNDALREYLDIINVVNPDDIHVHSNTEEEHLAHVPAMITKLKVVVVFCNPEKCEFHVANTDFLAYVVSV